MDYLIILGGSILGMLLLTAVKSTYVQRSSKYELDFAKAFKVYTTKHTGPIVVGFIVVFICMFVLPDTIAIAETGDQNSTYYRIVNNVTSRLRLYSVAIGVVGQGLGFIIIRRGEKFLREEEAKVKQEDEKNN